jgi:hypothetical protein
MWRGAWLPRTGFSSPVLSRKNEADELRARPGSGGPPTPSPLRRSPFPEVEPLRGLLAATAAFTSLRLRGELLFFRPSAASIAAKRG